MSEHIDNGTENPATKILRHIEAIKTEFGENYEGIAERMGVIESEFKPLKDMLDAKEARIVALESRATNPTGRVTTESQADASRREAAEWLLNNYRAGSGNNDWSRSDNGMQWRADQEETTDTKGGFLVPVPLLPEVLRIVEEHGVARRICRVIPMTSETLLLTKKNAGPTVYWPDEGVAGTQSGGTFTQGTLTAKLMMILDEVTLQVREDAAIEVAAYLFDLFGEAIALEEDTQAFNSTSPFTGLLQTASVGAHTIASTVFTGNLTYDDFVNTMFAANAHVVRRGRWLMSTDLLSEVMLIKDTQGRPLFTTPIGGENGIILGRPVEISEAMPKTADDATGLKTLAYGDFSRCIIGDRRQVAVDFSDDAGFEKATRMMRVLSRVGFITALPAAFGVLETA